MEDIKEKNATNNTTIVANRGQTPDSEIIQTSDIETPNITTDIDPTIVKEMKKIDKEFDLLSKFLKKPSDLEEASDVEEASVDSGISDINLIEAELRAVDQFFEREVMSDRESKQEDSSVDNCSEDTQETEIANNLSIDLPNTEYIEEYIEDDTANIEANTANIEADTANIEANTENIEEVTANIESVPQETQEEPSNTTGGQIDPVLSFAKNVLDMLEKYPKARLTSELSLAAASFLFRLPTLVFVIEALALETAFQIANAVKKEILAKQRGVENTTENSQSNDLEQGNRQNNDLQRSEEQVEAQSERMNTGLEGLTIVTPSLAGLEQENRLNNDLQRNEVMTVKLKESSNELEGLTAVAKSLTASTQEQRKRPSVNRQDSSAKVKGYQRIGKSACC